MSDDLIKDFVKKAEEELERAANSKPARAQPLKLVKNPLAEKLAAYCRNHAYCRKELEELLPFYGRQLEKLVLEAVAKGRPVDELVALVGRHLAGEATDEDIAKYLEGGGERRRQPTGRFNLFRRLFRR